MACSGETVLVVDDVAAQRYVTCKALAQAGYGVLEAATGHEAIQLAPTASAVVLDVFLPDIDGFEVCARLRAAPDTMRLPIVHTSAIFVESDHVAVGLQGGADAYLIQPVPGEVLVQVIASLIEDRKSTPAHPLPRPSPDRGAHVAQRPAASWKHATRGDTTQPGGTTFPVGTLPVGQ